jgi:hypothetical protein
MENIGEFMQQYATKEVFTVVAALATAWVGWKAATKTVGMAKGFAQKASFAGLTSAFLLFAGFGGIGVGIGELASRSGEVDDPNKPAETQLTNEELVNLATNSSTDGDRLEEILKYTTARDAAARTASTQPLPTKFTDAAGRVWKTSDDQLGTAEVASYIPTGGRPYEELPFEVAEQEEQSAIKNDESVMTTPMAWSSIGLGLAALIGSFGVFTTRRVTA